MTRHSGFGRRLAWVSLAAILVVPLRASSARADDGADSTPVGGVLRVRTMAMYSDGSVQFGTREFVGTPERAWDAAAAEGWVAVDTGATNTHHWRPRSKVNYGTTELARGKPAKKLTRKAAGKINKNRGTINAPAHKIKNTKHDIVPQNQFQSFAAYIFQFHQDSRNTIVMDPIDEFIFNISRALGGVVVTPDIFAVQYEFALVSGSVGVKGRQGNDAFDRQEGTIWIEHADLYIIHDYFERFEGFRLDDGLAFGFLANSGYEPTGWSDDAMGFMNAHVSETSYDNRQSDMWMQHQERDRFYYDGLTQVSTDAVLELIPIVGSVIDIGGNIAWYNGAEPQISQGPVLIESRLSAYNGNKKAVTVISRIDAGPPQRLRKVATQRARLDTWPRNDQGIGQWYPTVFFNAIRISSQKNLDKLVKAIAKFCVPMTIRDVFFPCILPVQIKHTAYASENGGKQTQTGTYYLWDSSAVRR